MNEWLNNLNSPETFFVKNGHTLQRVHVKDICWIHSEGNYCTLTTPEKKFVIKISLAKLQQRLPAKLFTQIHRSYIVQTELISRIDIGTNEVFIGSQALPLGRRFKSELIGRLNLLQ